MPNDPDRMAAIRRILARRRATPPSTAGRPVEFSVGEAPPPPRGPLGQAKDFVTGGFEQFRDVHAPRTGAQVASLADLVTRPLQPKPTRENSPFRAVAEAGFRASDEAQQAAGPPSSTGEMLGRLLLGEMAPTAIELMGTGGATRALAGVSRGTAKRGIVREAAEDAASFVPFDVATSQRPQDSSANFLAEMLEEGNPIQAIAAKANESHAGRAAFETMFGFTADIGLRTAGAIAADVPRVVGDRRGSFDTGGRLPGEVDQALPGRWRSTLNETIEGGQNIATAEQWAGVLRKAPGSRGERDWVGVDEFLASRAGQKVTKAELLAHVRNNGIKLTETVKGGPVSEFDADMGGPDATKFQQYTQPGGENYRETLIQLDQADALPDGFDVFQTEDIGLGSTWGVRFPDGREVTGWPNRGAAVASQARQAGSPQFTSSHFEEPNVLAHYRSTDRTVDGDKTLFIEEIQSDWHQKGRASGYRGENTIDAQIDAAQDELARVAGIADDAPATEWSRARDAHPELARSD